MSEGALAFVLNFDAELELEGGARYQPTAEVAARVVALARAMRATLPEGAHVIAPLGEIASGEATPVAWCPTPRALATIARAGLAPPPAPDALVLARVNARPFAFALAPDELEGAVLVRDEDAAARALERPGEWLLKRVLGVSGRGQRRVRGGAVSEADRAFVAASLRRHGALVIEPRVAIERELSVHGWALAERSVVRSIRAQRVDAHGAFADSTLATGLDAATERALVDTGERVGRSLAAAGYLGPFGVDAFVHRGEGERPRALRTLSEINARFCMGWDARDGWRAPR